jgi:hypothetical protein
MEEQEEVPVPKEVPVPSQVQKFQEVEFKMPEKPVMNKAFGFGKFVSKEKPKVNSAFAMMGAKKPVV